MNKTILITGFLILLMSNVALATSVTTDYAGLGEFSMYTTILSPIAPDITDSVHINTGCCGTCCCPNDCCPPTGEIGVYEGHLSMTNTPFSGSYHWAQTDDGCIEINQNYVEHIDGQSIYTNYYTYFNGTGYAESYVYVIPGEAISHQNASGAGTGFVEFRQIAFLDGEFDYETNYGGEVWICSNGYASLENYYNIIGGEAMYNTQLEMYCAPVGGGTYSFLFADGTDHFNLNSEASGSYLDFCQDINVEGLFDYGFSALDPDEFNFNFDMEIW